jgi:hypothetical protein
MDEDEPHLKVTDRRHFTADGQLKEDALVKEEAPVKEDAPAQAPGPGASSSSAPRLRGTQDSQEVVTFSSFIVSLATQAADFLVREDKDLGGVRQVISAIEMLKDKTEGRRTDDESKIIEAILFDLRLAFVASAKGPTS